MLLEYIVDKYGLDLEKQDLNEVKMMILGQKPGLDRSRDFLFEIVSSQENSVDVDKFDYICRDAYNIGMRNIHFDPVAIIENARVLGNKLCFHSENDYDVYGLFQARYQLFKDVYTQRVNRAINHMVCDALLAANPTYRFLEMIQNPAEYVKMTDCVFEWIVHSKKPVSPESER